MKQFGFFAAAAAAAALLLPLLLALVSMRCALFPTDSVVVSLRNVDTDDLITNFNAMGHSETQSKKTNTGFFFPLFYDRGEPRTTEPMQKAK